MIPIRQQSIPVKKGTFLSRKIPNSKDRKLFVTFLFLSLILIFTGLMYISYNHQTLMSQDFRHYKGTFKQLGSISRIGFFAALAIYPVFWVLKQKQLKSLQLGQIQIKPLVQSIAKIVRKWHVPVGLLSAGIVFLHSFLALIRGFKVNFTYLSGMGAVIVLLFLMVMGINRFKRTDRNWHLKLAIAFLVLFMLHATFA
ncbi:hypothetical protein V7182_12490 [Neobacillus drentensis]|uniref:hypothetical protein n=1 Tax=Neobacillus drentensis TaxID=220684 RepID=UPI002FFFDB85